METKINVLITILHSAVDFFRGLRFFNCVSEIPLEHIFCQFFPSLCLVFLANLNFLYVLTAILIILHFSFPLEPKLDTFLSEQLHLLFLHLSLLFEDTLKNHLVWVLFLHLLLVLTTFTCTFSVELFFGKIFNLFIEVHHGVLKDWHFGVRHTIL